MEEWRLAPNTEGFYEVSSEGRLRRVDRGNYLTPSPRKKDGYCRVTLCIYGKARSEYLHILAASAFFGPCPKGQNVNHKNGNKSDNRVANLEYLTTLEHERHTRYVLCRNRGPVGEASAGAILTEQDVRAIHAAYCTGDFTQKELATQYGVELPTVNGLLNGYTWKHLGLPAPPKRDYHLRGTDNPKGKVTPELAAEICRLYAEGVNGHRLASRFGLGPTTIYRVLNNSRPNS